MTRPRDGLHWTTGVEERLAALGVLDEVRGEVAAVVDLGSLTVWLQELIGPDLIVDGATDCESTDWSLWLWSQLDDEGDDDWVEVAKWGLRDD